MPARRGAVRRSQPPPNPSEMSQPLTILSDDEEMFRDAVAGFANEEVRPRVQQMERDGKFDPALITKFFEMGLMGIEVAEEYGGSGGTCTMIAIGVEEL